MSGDTVLRATIGGLLHDIGKIWAQGSRPDPKRSHWDCEGGPECQCRQKWGHSHAAMGGHMVAEVFGQESPFAEAVALHHAANASARAIPIIACVQEGDRLSAGERDDQYDPGEGAAGSPLPLLISPLAGSASSARVRPRPLVGSWPPVEEADSSTPMPVQQWYDDLARAFRDGGAKLRSLQGDALVDGVLGLVENVGSLAPSAFWRTRPDISLAMHLHLAGAFAGALAAVDDPEADPCATIIAGDLSGIQAFLHRAATARAARQLRARSFYLSLLSLVVARTFARDLGVTPAHVVTASGGNFLVVAPPGCDAKAEQIARHITAELQTVHGPVLDVIVASTQMRRSEASQFGAVVRRVRSELHRRKLRRLDGRTAPALFAPRGAGGASEACRACGADGARPAEEESERLCPFCAGLVELGSALPTKNFLTLSSASASQEPGWRDAFARLGWKVELHERVPDGDATASLLVLDAERLREAPHGRLFVSGRYVPRKRDGGVVEFKELAQRGPGRSLLACAKLDVDDLGFFIRGLGSRGSVSPSRFASASRFLSLFFEGHIDVAAERRGAGDIYLIYSGGDDAALVGHWRGTIEFVAELRREFRRWAAGNPDLHFSAGISFGAPDRPVALALAEAEDALALAKAEAGKDRCTLFGIPFRWDDVEEVLRWTDRLATLVQDGHLSRGALQVLQVAREAIDELDPLGKPRYGPAMWRVPHRLRRARGESTRKEAEQLAADVEQQLVRAGGPARLVAAARLAEWQTWRGERIEEPIANQERRSR
ncbi:CRISPR-associated protein Cas10/Csm1 [bacterium HR29]|nr:CRISPR-associated protein Cas10/Csm1 [bacterium HR29]